jgi:hypothetical protein
MQRFTPCGPTRQAPRPLRYRLRWWTLACAGSLVTGNVRRADRRHNCSPTPPPHPLALTLLAGRVASEHRLAFSAFACHQQGAVRQEGKTLRLRVGTLV